MEIPLFIQLLFWLTILVASVYFFIFWLLHVLKQRRIIKSSGEKAIADVINYKTVQDADGKTIYCPVLEFTTSTGKRMVVDTDPEDGRLYKHREGKKFTVFYSPDKPHQYYIAGSVPFQAYLLLIGVPTILCAGYSLVRIILSF